jgi:hypothetical protein
MERSVDSVSRRLNNGHVVSLCACTCAVMYVRSDRRLRLGSRQKGQGH